MEMRPPLTTGSVLPRQPKLGHGSWRCQVTVGAGFPPPPQKNTAMFPLSTVMLLGRYLKKGGPVRSEVSSSEGGTIIKV